MLEGGDVSHLPSVPNCKAQVFHELDDVQAVIAKEELLAEAGTEAR